MTYGLSKTDEDFVYATVVARTGNVVVTLTYNGAGYRGAKTPSSGDIVKGAQKAVKEAVAAVEKTADSEDARGRRRREGRRDRRLRGHEEGPGRREG
ncbi:hypothetical protein SBADM41S_09276 [Streptomyces badius]